MVARIILLFCKKILEMIMNTLCHNKIITMMTLVTLLLKKKKITMIVQIKKKKKQIKMISY